MKIVCPGCAAEYNVDESRIPAEGMKATCPKCMNSWTVGAEAGAGTGAGAAGSAESPEALGSDPGTAMDFPQDGAPPWQDAPPEIDVPPPTPPPPPKSVPKRQPVSDPLDFDDAPSGGDDAESEASDNEIFLFGKLIPLPDHPIPRMLLRHIKVIVPLAVILIVGMYAFSKFVSFGKDLRDKGATWGQADFLAMSFSDFSSAHVPLKDTIEASGSFEEHWKAGLAAYDRDTFAGYSEAEQSFRKAGKLSRKNALSRAYLAETYAHLKEYGLTTHVNTDEWTRLSWAQIDRAKTLDPKLADAFRAQAEFELVNNNDSKAKEAIDQAIALNNTEARNFLTQGRMEYRQGTTEMALRSFKQAVAGNPNLTAAQYYLGLVLERSAEYGKAEEAFLKAISLSSGHSRAYLALARMKFERFNLVDDALVFANKVLNDHAGEASSFEKGQAKFLVAKALYQKGDFDGAVAAITEARTMDPYGSQLVIFEGKLKQEKEPTFKVDTYVDSLVKADMQDADYFLFKGDLLAKRGAHGDAIEVLNKVVVLDPANAEAHYLLGRSYELSQENEKALESYYKALRADRGFPDAYVRLASLQIDKGLFDEAMKLLQEINSRNDRIPAIHNLIGIVALRKNDFNAARKAFDVALEINPRFPDAYRSLARLAIAKGDWPEAEKATKRAMELDPEGVETLFLSAEIYEGTQRFSEAVGTADRILAKEPKNVRALIAGGRAALGMKDYEKAQKFLGRAVEITETNPMVFFLLGRAYFFLQKYDEAQRSYQNAQRFDDKNPEIFFRLGENALEYNKVSESVAFLKEALSLKPDHFEALGVLGQAYLRLNSKQEAITQFEKQLALCKNPAAKSQIFLTLGEAQRTDSPDEALQNFKKALQLDSKNARAYYGVGQIQEENNKAVEASKFYRQAIAVDKKFALPHRHLGFIYANQNLKAQALQSFQNYLRLDPQAKDREEIREQMSYLH